MKPTEQKAVKAWLISSVSHPDDRAVAFQKETAEFFATVPGSRVIPVTIVPGHNEAERERDRYREALDYYACADHYTQEPNSRAVIFDDRGERARQALEGDT